MSAHAASSLTEKSWDSDRGVRSSLTKYLTYTALFSGFMLLVAVAQGYGGRSAIAGAAILTSVAVLTVLFPRKTNWAAQVSVLVAFVILIPTRIYKLPVELPFDLEIFRLVAIVIFMNWFSVLLVNPEISVRRTPVTGCVLLLMATTIFSILWNLDDISQRGELAKGVKALLEFATLPLIYFFVVSNIRTRRDIDLVVKVVLLLMGVTVIFGIFERFTGYSVFRHLHEYLPFMALKENASAATAEILRGGIRIFGSAAHPIAYSVMLAMVLPLSVHFAHRAGDWISRVGYSALSLLFILGIIFTGSRTGFLSLLVIFAVWTLFMPESRKSFALIGVAIIFIVHMLLPGALATFRTVLSPSYIQRTELGPIEGNVGTRLEDYPRIWQEFVKQPLFGRGWDTFDPYKYFFVDNQYLKFLVEIGVAGFSVFAYFYYRVAKLFWNRTRDSVGEAKSFYVGLLATSLVFAFSTYTFDIFGFPQVPYLFFMIVGLGVAFFKCQEESNGLVFSRGE